MYKATAEDLDLRQETPLVPGKINGCPVNCVLDNGSELDLISESFLEDHLQLSPDRPVSYTMKSANGHVDNLSGVVENVDLAIEGIHTNN